MKRFNSTLRLEALEDRRVLTTLVQPAIGSNNFGPTMTLICAKPAGDLVIDPAFTGHGQFQTGFEGSSANGQLSTNQPSSGPGGSQVGYPSVNGLLIIDPGYNGPVGNEVDRPSANAASLNATLPPTMGSGGCSAVTPVAFTNEQSGHQLQLPLVAYPTREMEPSIGFSMGASADSVDGAFSAWAIDEIMVKPEVESVSQRPTQDSGLVAEEYHGYCPDLSSRPTYSDAAADGVELQ